MTDDIRPTVAGGCLVWPSDEATTGIRVPVPLYKLLRRRGWTFRMPGRLMGSRPLEIIHGTYRVALHGREFASGRGLIARSFTIPKEELPMVLLEVGGSRLGLSASVEVLKARLELGL